MTTPDPQRLLPPGDGTMGYVRIGDLTLDSGVVLPQITIALQCWGTMNKDGSNVVLIEHALTGDSHVVGPQDATHPTPGWWPGMVGPGCPIDTNKWFVICTNTLGGCRGTTGPSSLHPDGHYWGARFPAISIRDMVRAEAKLADILGIERFASIIGGSMGGARTLEWMIMYPERVASAGVLAVGSRASADQIGWQTTQILAITSDPAWQQGGYHGTGREPIMGLGIARRIAHLSYRSEYELDTRFANRPAPGEDPIGEDLSMQGRYAVQSYLDHQASKLIARFDACCYVLLTDALNRHDIGRDRGGIQHVLQNCPVPAVICAVDTDRLYPLRQIEEIANNLPNCDGVEMIHSLKGHDGFLAEADQTAAILRKTMALAEADERVRV